MRVVKDGVSVGRVGIAHWWPERGLYGEFYSPFPTFMRRRARKRGSRYMTMAYADLPGGLLAAFAACCKKDHPTRAQGRFIALLRLARLLKSMGMKMERS